MDNLKPYADRTKSELIRKVALLTQRVKKVETALKESEAKLREQTKALEQKNAALKELLAQIEIEKQTIKEQIYTNVEKLILPTLKELKTSKSHHPKYIELLEHNIMDLTSSFGIRISNEYAKLTPREIEICNMIRSGFSSKDISKTLHISSKTVERHRNNIRKKLGIVKQNFNLISYLKIQFPTCR